MLIDREAVTDPRVRTFPLHGPAGLLPRLISGLTLSVGALLMVVGLLRVGLLTLAGVGAALPVAGHPPHLLKLTLSPRSAVTRRLGIPDGPLGTPVGLLG
jgi:hypothetical protein